MSDKVSVLIPVYNRPELIVRSVRCALTQTHRNLEVVVSDNASTDDTWQVVQRQAGEDSRVRAFRNDTNLGPTRNWIRALSEATGDYVKVLFSDDWLEPTCIEQLIARMDGQADVSLAFTSAMAHFPNEEHPSHHFPETPWFTGVDYIRQSLLGSNMPVSPACALVRRSVVRFRHPLSRSRRQNEIAERYGAGPDLLFLLDAAAASSRIANIPEFLTHFDGGRSSITVNHWPIVAKGYRLARQQFAGEVVSREGLRDVKHTLRIRRLRKKISGWQRTIKRAIGIQESAGDGPGTKAA